MNLRRILTSFLVIGVAGAAVVAATTAFFSDTETSSGNVFAAGTIDLRIGNVSYYNGVANPGTSWTLRDLTIERFFDFLDVKPGDLGQDVIEVAVGSNDAYMCANVSFTQNSENGVTEPESDLGDTAPDGELADELDFFFWNDDGDNVYETGETAIVGGMASDIFPAGGTLAFADSDENNIGGTVGDGVAADTAFFIGKAWCYGELSLAPVAPGSGDVVTNPGYSCNGADATNIAQSDVLSGNISFYAVQTRNNPGFQCSSVDFPDNVITTVTTDDLADNAGEVASNPNSWFFYNDSNDTIDPTLGTAVAGPATPPYGTGSFEFTLGANPLDRKNIATYQFSGTPLSTITSMSFGAYSHNGSGGAGPNESPFFNFNVDFNGTDTWQRRLVYVPSANGSVSQDTWNEYDMINGGAALWTWSGYASNGNKWPDNDTDQYRTWNEILSAFPGVRIRVTDSWLGVRVGEPGPTGYIGNVDFFEMNSVVFDFDN